LVNGVVSSQLLPALFAVDARVGVIGSEGEIILTLDPGFSELAFLALPDRAVIADVRIPASALAARQSFVTAAGRSCEVAATIDPILGLRASLLTRAGWWCWSRPLSDTTGLTPCLADSYADECHQQAVDAAQLGRPAQILQQTLLRRAFGGLCRTDERGNDA